MSQLIAVKRLTASDLTFFEWHFRHRNAGNQKAINLNADIFIDQLFPRLPTALVDSGGRLPVDLRLYGPGMAGEYALTRKIIKGGGYKNWRLDGEFIYNPDDHLDRFNDLQPGDIALLDFEGDPAPVAATVVLIARALDTDSDLHAALDAQMQQKPMIAVTSTEVLVIIEAARVPPDHPVRAMIIDEAALEDAVRGGIRGLRQLDGRRGPRISRSQLLRARAGAERIGQLGEFLINSYLETQTASAEIESFEWRSQQNAVSPFDFRIVVSSELAVVIDVKSTAGEFDRPIHISMNELDRMFRGPERYDLFRVFEVTESSGRLRIATDVREFAGEILGHCRSFPAKVGVDSISVLPDIFDFGPEIPLHAQ